MNRPFTFTAFGSANKLAFAAVFTKTSREEKIATENFFPRIV